MTLKLNTEKMMALLWTILLFHLSAVAQSTDSLRVPGIPRGLFCENNPKRFSITGEALIIVEVLTPMQVPQFILPFAFIFRPVTQWYRKCINLPLSLLSCDLFLELLNLNHEIV